MIKNKYNSNRGFPETLTTIPLLFIILFISSQLHAALVAYWPLSQGSGQIAVDASGSVNDGTLGDTTATENSDPTWVSDSIRGNVLEWAGSGGPDQWINLTQHLASFKNLNQGTITAWINIAGADGASVILAASDSGDASSEIRFHHEHNEGLIFDVRDDNSNPTGEDGNISCGEEAVADNNWHHVAITVDTASNANLYVDGQRLASGREPFFSSVTGLDHISLGRNIDSGGTQWTFKGRISDVSVFDCPLDAVVIEEIHNGQRSILDVDNYALNPLPAHNETGTYIKTLLSWTGNDTIDSYDVYFAEDDQPLTLATNTDQTKYTPIKLFENTTYNWRIDTRDTDGTLIATGDLWSFTTGQTDSFYEESDIFIRYTEGYSCYRIPSIIVAPNGDVLAFCEGRKNDCGDDGDVDIVMKRSTDNARTWGPLELIYEEGGNAMITIGNPCPVVDKSTGRLWMPFCRDNDRVFVGYSDDSGYTWSQRTEITSDVRPTDFIAYGTGPGVGIQLEHHPYKGRLVIPCWHRFKFQYKASHMIYSDDNGQTWALSESIMPASNESQAVELTDGTVMCNSRTPDSGQDLRAVSTSTDGGHTWSAPQHDPELPEPTCQASILRFTTSDSQDIDRILFSNPAHTTDRVNMTVRLSYDEADTWPAAKQIYSGTSAYSCLVVIPDWTLGCLYEKDGYDTISLARFSLEWLTDGADTLDFCPVPIVGDFNNDCDVNLEDFAMMANNWLNCNLIPKKACPDY